MDTDPQYFFKELSASLEDDTKGHHESLRLLDTLNRNLIEEQIDSSVIDVYLLHIFNSNGLLQFIDLSVKNKKFNKSSKVAVEILYTIVNNFPSKVPEQDILSLFTLCTKVLNSNTDGSVKVKLFQLLLVSLEKCDGCVECKNAAEVFEKLLEALYHALYQKHTDSVKSKEMIVLGFIAKKYPYFIKDPQRLQQTLWTNFELHLASLAFRKVTQNVIEGFFTGFMYFIESYPLKEGTSEYKKISCSLYKTLKVLVIPKDKIKIGNRAALHFLANNTTLFGDNLLSEYEFWHNHLSAWLNMGPEERKTGVTALRAFFQCIAASIGEKEGDEWRQVVIYFNEYSKTKLESRESSSSERRLAIFCLKQFSRASYKHLSPDEVTNLFLTIMQNFEETYILDYDPSSEQWEYLPDYVQAVANFMSFKEFTAGEFFCLQRAVISMVKSFHHLPMLHYGLVVDALVMTLFHLKKTQYFDVFLENVVYQGVVWSCSHQHVSNEVFSEDTTQKVVTVKNYFPLWIGIVKLSSNRSYEKHGFGLEDRKFVFERTVNELVKTLMLLINKLNVSVKLKGEDVVVTDVGQAYRVEATNDYAIFLNVVDFYQEIFGNVQPRVFRKCICKIITHLVDKCLKYPLISGFYKLLSFSLKIIRELELFSTDRGLNADMMSSSADRSLNAGASGQWSDRGLDVENCQTTLATFLSLLLNKMAEFKDELLISCLQVLLGTPVVVIQDMLPSCVVPLLNVFEVGRSYLPLARMGLETLDYWQENVDPDIFEPVLRKIIPSLDSYLRSKSLRGFGQGTVEKRRKTQQAVRKRKVLLELEPELVKLQRDILCFMGRQSLRTLQTFIFSDDGHVPNFISGLDAHLKVTLPYEDLRLDVYLDGFLPRIIDLALHSSDRKTRITACELLQACVMVFLGRAKPMSQSGLEDLKDTLKTIAMPLLQLGCDIDQVVEQIFRPLFLQLIHWYTSPTQARGTHTAIVIDTLMDGISHPTNSSLRDFSGKCLNEFVRWTIKQSNEQSLARDCINIKVLVKNMRFLSSHPNASKKLGAALIFNNIYREIREEEALISIFWLEILHILVLGLSTLSSFEESTTVAQLKLALRHVQRVFVEKPFVFREPDEKRRIPNDFRSGLLRDVAVWILKCTASTAKHCREICMELFVNLVPLSGEGRVNVQNFIADNLERPLSSVYYDAMGKFEELKGENSSVLLKWMQGFLCALDGYHFIIVNNLERVSFENNPFFSEIGHFLRRFQSIGISEALNLIDPKAWVFTAMDKEQYASLKSSCCLAILRLFNSLLHDEVLCKHSLTLWGRDLWKLLLNVLFLPQVLGLNDVMNPDYANLLTILLNTIPRKLPEIKVAEFKASLASYIDAKFETALDLKKNVTLKQRNVLKGIVLLGGTNFNQIMKIDSYATGLTDKLVQAFRKDAAEDGRVIFVNEIQDTTLAYVTSLLKFALTNYDEFLALVAHLHQQCVVQSMEFTREMSFGAFFLSTFAEAVVPVLLANFDSFVSLSLTKNDLKTTVELVSVALTLMMKEKRNKTYYKNVAECLFERWQPFVVYFSSNEGNKREGLEYLKLLVETGEPPCEEVNAWIVQCLMEGDGVNDLEIFQLLVSTATDDVTEEKSNELKTALTIFNYRLATSTNTSNNPVTVNKLLTSLPLVRSLPIFEFLISHFVRIETTVEISSLLASFAKSIDNQLQRKILAHAYSMSCDPEKGFDCRYKVATEVIPPLFLNSDMSVFEEFFVENIATILQKLGGSELEAATVHFTLVEVLFLRIPIGTPARDVCSISAAADKPKLLPVLAGLALNAFKVQIDGTELARKFKCHAYNALASIVSNSIRKPDFYDKLFIREFDGNDILWRGVVNTEAVYDFPVLFDTLPQQRKVLVSIRDELREQQRQQEYQSRSLRYIESQRLFNSSLSEDVTNFDFTNAVLRAQGRDEEGEGVAGGVQSLVPLDGTHINSHECMGTICGLVQHIFATGVNEFPSEGENDVTLPNWMNGIRNTLLNDNTHRNVKIFLVKVIENMQDIFSHYSKWFLEPLMQIVIQKCAGEGMNYFVTDVLVILSRWASQIIDLSETEKVLATDLLDFLMKNLTRERQDVFKYNLDILKMIVESWKHHLKVRSATVFGLFSSDETALIGVHVSSVLLVNGLKPWEVESEMEFLKLLLGKMKSTGKSTYRPCAETVGLVLSILDDERFTGTVDSSLKKIQDMEKYVLCLEGIAIHFPLLIDTYHIGRLIGPLNQVPEAQQIVHLKIICKRVSLSVDILDETSDFKIVSWDKLLEHSNLEVQIIALEIVKKCLSAFVAYDTFRSVVETMTRNVSNSNALYRGCLYDIAAQVCTLEKDETGACKDMLIYGLVDADGDNRKKVTKFWTDNSFLPNTVIRRFPFLLSEMYKSKVEDKFLGFVTYFLIQLLSQSDSYDAEVFEHPLEDCDFEDYRLQTNWRLQHPSVVPMFAETLLTYDPSEIQGDSNPFKLRQTQTTFDFAPTQSVQEQQLLTYTSLETSLPIGGDIKNPNALVLSQKYRMPKRRFLKDKAKISKSHAHYETNKQVKKAQKRIDSAIESEKNVTIYRSYRKGDFPDIQIALSSVLKPLQMLAMHDNEISKILFLEIFKGLAGKTEDDRAFLETVSHSIKRIFESSTQFNPHLFAALLDILLKNKAKIAFDPQLVCYAAQESGLVSTGALLLEEYILSLDDDGPSSSKRSVGQDGRETLYWVKLAELYKELEDWDAVRSIFLHKMDCGEAVHLAIRYESESNHRNALDLYKRLIETDASPHRKDFYYESYFKCFAEMGEWQKLPATVAAVVDGPDAWDALWDGGWNQQKLLPWYVKAHVRNDLRTGLWDEQFLRDMNRCLSDADKNDYLRANFSEELFAMWLGQGDLPAAGVYAQSCARAFLDQWRLVDPMLQALRFRKLLDLRDVVEGSDFLRAHARLSSDPEATLGKLEKAWRRSQGDVLPSLVMNETRLLYRKRFVELLLEKIGGIEGMDLSENIKKLRASKIRMDIDFVNVAADSGNFYFARKYYKRYEGKEEANVKLKMALGNILWSKTKLASKAEDEIKWAIPAVDTFASITTSSKDQMVVLSCTSKLFDIYSKLSQTLASNPDLFDNDFKKLLSAKLGKEVNDLGDVELCAVYSLKEAIDNVDEDMECENSEYSDKHKQMSAAYVKLAHFIRDRGDQDLQGDFIRFVLRAMKMNSSEGRQLFPCLLMQTKLESRHKTTFLNESDNIPTWMFLGWVPQLLANVDSPKIFAISKIIERIAETYPQAIMYPYRLSRENYKFLDGNIKEEAQQLIDRLDDLLLKDETVNKFLKALSYISVPAGILRYHIDKMVKAGSLDGLKSIQESVKNEFFSEMVGTSRVENLLGNMFKKVQYLKKEFSKSSGTSFAEAKKNWEKIKNDLSAMMRDKNNSLLLKDYCPWLANFSANKLNVELEIPGQYDGKKMPLPQHHVKVSGFCPNVRIMDSLRRPIKITMLGMDTKEYPFLVKFGEDIRQDQRIEQLFGLMNDIFKSDRVCSKNNLEILTYQVIPLTSNLGIIQWIDGTQQLNDFLGKSMENKKTFDRLKMKYFQALSKGANELQRYGNSAVRLKRDQVVPFFRSLVNELPWDLLKTSFWSLSSSTENYIALRTNFIKTYATLCASHWLLGIGDRHLNNALISLRNGKVLGIDFGMAFGTATQNQPAPELVPFRLTPRVAALMAPLGERGPFGECLAHCLRSLRANGAALIATMNVFVEEPSLDWLEHATAFEDIADADQPRWYPKVKVDQAKRKLKGASSTKIMVEDLIAGKRVESFTAAFVQLVRGEEGRDARAKFADSESLTVEEQVECLIDHATDNNLLGRMFVGWMPWV